MVYVAEDRERGFEDLACCLPSPGASIFALRGMNTMAHSGLKDNNITFWVVFGT